MIYNGKTKKKRFLNVGIQDNLRCAVNECCSNDNVVPITSGASTDVERHYITNDWHSDSVRRGGSIWNSSPDSCNIQ